MREGLRRGPAPGRTRGDDRDAARRLAARLDARGRDAIRGLSARVYRSIGRPDAIRAVARANGFNRIAIMVPCHRILTKDGQPGGYGGGIWRKHRVIELEASGILPFRDPEAP